MKLLEMPWLPSVAEGFRANVRALREASVFDPAQARRLASHRLDISQLHSLARALPAQRIVQSEGCIRLSVLSNTTAELIVPAVVATAPRHLEVSPQKLLTQIPTPTQGATTLSCWRWTTGASS